MITLRKKYHDLENKLSAACLLASGLKDSVDALKQNPSDQTAQDEILKNVSTIQTKIIEVVDEISNLKKFIYRSIDPDIDIQVILNRIKDENKKIKIFIVDDEKSITEELTKKYESEGFIINSALDTKEAIAKIEDFEPAIVITDICFSQGNEGLDIIKFIKDKMSWIQILVVSRVTDENIIHDINGLGVEDQHILIKPVKFSQINAKLSGMIQNLKR